MLPSTSSAVPFNVTGKLINSTAISTPASTVGITLGIIGTVVITLFVNLNVAVIAFTAIFYLANKVLWTSNPIRDLKPLVETEAMVGEEIIDDIPKD
jgi:hypothetical protein